MTGGTVVSLARLLGTDGVRSLLEETCRFFESSVEIQDPDGSRVGAFGAGGTGSPASADVLLHGSAIGTVTARPARRGDEGAAAGLARHVAGLLGEFAAREYELDDLSREILDSYEEVNLFYEVSEALPAADGVGGVCRIVLEGVCRIIPARRASILLLDESRRELRLAAAIGIDEAEWEGIRMGVGQGVSGRVLETRLPRLVDDVRELPGGLLTGYERYATRSFISVPLCLGASLPKSPDPRRGPAATRSIGVINLTDRRDGRNFSSGDLKLLCALANQAAVLVENVRLLEVEREVQLARRIQRSLLPDCVPRVPGADAAGLVESAGGVGGDYYDFVVRDGGRELAVAIADVSGHGVPAALLMAVARSVLRNGMRQAGGPAEALAAMNRHLFEDLDRAEHFLSAFCAFFDPASGVLRYASAGHPAALLVRSAGGPEGVESLEAEGMVAGVDAEVRFEEGRVALGRDDAVFLCTDGLLEALGVDGSRFGRPRFVAAARAAAGSPASEAVRRILDAVHGFARADGIRDDISVVALKVA